MHHHLEVIIPPTFSVEEALKVIMKPFDESSSFEEDDNFSGQAFWDYWVIGGRWSGSKLQAKLDDDKIEAFIEKLNEMNITVSGIVFGKQEISPADQIPAVDKLWNEMFPDSGSEHCPIFQHSGDDIKYDVCTLAEAPKDMKCSHLIIATDKNYDDTWEAEYMISDSFWNGVNHIDTTWDGTIKHGLEMANKKFQQYVEEARDKYIPRDDWLVITVDYHS